MYMRYLIFALCLATKVYAMETSRRNFLVLGGAAVIAPSLPKIAIDAGFGEIEIVTQLSNSYLLNQHSVLLGTSNGTIPINFLSLLRRQNELAQTIAQKISFFSRKYDVTQEKIWLNVMRAFDLEPRRIAKIESEYEPIPLELRREFYEFCSTLSKELGPDFLKEIKLWYESFEFDWDYDDELPSTIHNWLEIAAYQWQDFVFFHRYHLDRSERRTISLKAAQYDLDFAANLGFHPARLWEEIDRRSHPWNYLPYGDNYLSSRFDPLPDVVIENYLKGLDEVFPEGAQEMRMEIQSIANSMLEPKNRFSHLGEFFTLECKPIQFTIRGLANFESDMQLLGIIIPSHPDRSSQVHPQFQNVMTRYFLAKAHWGFDMNRSVKEQLGPTTAPDESIQSRPAFEGTFQSRKISRREKLLNETPQSQHTLRSLRPIVKSILPKIANLTQRVDEVFDCIQILSSSERNQKDKQSLLIDHDLIIPAVDVVHVDKETDDIEL